MLLKKCIIGYVLCLFMVFSLSNLASAITLYDNTNHWGSYGGICIDGINKNNVSDSFLLPNNSIVTGIAAIMMVPQGGIYDSIDWAITTAPFSGTTIASGTVVNPSFNHLATYGFYDYSEVSFTIPSLSLAGNTTFYLQLGNAYEHGSIWGYQPAITYSDGPSTAYAGSGPNLPDGHYVVSSQIYPHAFQITGDINISSTVPEPATMLLLSLGLGLVGVAGVRRKLK